MTLDVRDPVADGQQPITWGSGLRRLLSLCNNPLSAIGLFVVAGTLLLLIGFQMFSLFGGGMNPYFDVLGYMVLPGVFIFGLIIVPVGAAWKRHWLRKHAGKRVPAHVQINLADGATRGAVMIFLAVTFFVVLPGLAVSAYRGYIYTESTDFCANVCHTVMEPQGTAHADSPHARVSCAECHIGAGADWFVKSKLSGTRQVFAVWFDTYSRPIPPAIRELRPARETCEECHWPSRFFGAQLKHVVYYSPDEQNTRREARMLLKIGGASEATGRVEGIHRHMLADGPVEFVATDPQLQHVPWVRYTQPDGTAIVYRSDGQPVDDPPPAGIRRTIDCMDCHNRGAHHFNSPQQAIDAQLEAGRIAHDLPYIKREAVNAIVQDYASTAAADAGIMQHLVSFYQTQYPQVWQQREPVVRAAIDAVQAAYHRNFFPAMNVSWRTYPENVGHTISSGCFRCHDGLHTSATGETISSDCMLCHTFLNTVDGQPGEFRAGRFHHALPLGGHEDLRCDQCHTGGRLNSCRDCHAELHGLDEWRDTPGLRRSTTQP